MDQVQELFVYAYILQWHTSDVNLEGILCDVWERLVSGRQDTIKKETLKLASSAI